MELDRNIGTSSSRPPPLTIELEQPLRADGDAARARRMLPISVLVVDDDRHFRHALRELLDQNGFDVDEAENGLDAFNKITNAGLAPDVLVIDLRMPTMDGVALLSALRVKQSLAAIPAIVVSAYLGTGTIDGATKAVGKDEALSTLVDEIRALVTGRASRRAR